MTSANAQSMVLHADKEHAGLRATVMLVVILGFVVSFFVLNTFLNSSMFAGSLLAAYALPLSCALGLVLALALAGLSEALMKRYWPSGRRLVIDERGLQAVLPDDKEAKLDWSGRVWAIRWFFSLAGYPRGGRERRLTAKHTCLACQLQQDDERLIVYSYLKAAEAETLLASGDFHKIEPAEYYERGTFRRFRGGTDRPQLPAKVLTGKDGPFWLAEQRRWTSGLELTPGDFANFYETVRERVEE
jgi:hypothetical protein